MTVSLYLKLLTVTTGKRHNKTKQRTGSNQIFKIMLFSRACFSRARLTLKMQAFSFMCLTPNGRPWSQAFLAETVETGDKNRDDFHCMQMSLVMSRWCAHYDCNALWIQNFQDGGEGPEISQVICFIFQ